MGKGESVFALLEPPGAELVGRPRFVGIRLEVRGISNDLTQSPSRIVEVEEFSE